MRSSLQMDGHLVMKSSSFTVKDILDLPEGKLACSPVPADTTTTGSLRTIASVPEMPAGQFGYDTSDNPYTRWLQNNEHYTRKLFVNNNNIK